MLAPNFLLGKQLGVASRLLGHRSKAPCTRGWRLVQGLGTVPYNPYNYTERSCTRIWVS
jgi:hypothetical protein